MRKALRHLVPIVLVALGLWIKTQWQGSFAFNLAGVFYAVAGCYWADMMMPTIIAAAKYAALHPLPPKAARRN